MIERLHIRNFALIDDIVLEFTKGLNTITGETGAGKSIIINALNLLLGERVNTSIIRKGKDRAVIEGVLDVARRNDVIFRLKESGIECNENEGIIIKREINVNGRNHCYINSSPTTVQKLKEIGNLLIDIHGQHEHQSLLKTDLHIELLDAYGKLNNERELVVKYYNEYKQVKGQIEQMQLNEKEKERMTEILRFAIKEIEDISLQPGEYQELEKRYQLLKNQGKIFEVLENVYNLIYSQGSSVNNNLDSALKEIERVSQYDKEIGKIEGIIREVYYQNEDAISQLREYKDKLIFQPEELDNVIERIDSIKRLLTKYKVDESGLLEYKKQCEMDFDSISKSEEELDKLNSKLNEIIQKLNSAAINLSGRRRVVAKLLKEKIEEQLNELGMKKAQFNVSIAQKESENGLVLIDGKRYEINQKGIDNVEFMISPNLGEDLKPLAKISSGGEISRIMLAIKSILAEIDGVESMIFDEIDVGIGGEIANIVGKKLRVTSENKQIISITHLPQIARFATTHYSVKKDEQNGRTVTSVKKLNDEDRIIEIARMMSGDRLSDSAIQNAREFVNEVPGLLI